MTSRSADLRPWRPEPQLPGAAGAGLPSVFRASALATHERYQHLAREAALLEAVATPTADRTTEPHGADMPRRLRDWLRLRPVIRGASPLPGAQRGEASLLS